MNPMKKLRKNSQKSIRLIFQAEASTSIYETTGGNYDSLYSSIIVNTTQWRTESWLLGFLNLDLDMITT